MSYHSSRRLPSGLISPAVAAAVESHCSVSDIEPALPVAVNGAGNLPHRPLPGRLITGQIVNCSEMNCLLRHYVLHLTEWPLVEELVAGRGEMVWERGKQGDGQLTPLGLVWPQDDGYDVV